jgi:hypothetical protein
MTTSVNQYQPVESQNGFRPPTHNQGVVGSCPTGPTLKIKHLQTQPVGVLFFTPGRRQDLENFGGFVPKKIGTEIRFILNELIYSDYQIKSELLQINFTSVFISDSFSGLNLFVFCNSKFSLIPDCQIKS